MNLPAANVRTLDRARALRAVLGFRSNDALAVEHVARDASSDTEPEAVAMLVLALTELAANFLGPDPTADERLREILLEHARRDAEPGAGPHQGN